MIINDTGAFKQHSLKIKITILAVICVTLIANPAISIPFSDINVSSDYPEEIGQSKSANCSVEILKPTIGIAYFFDEFEFPLLLITLPIIIGGISCKAEVNVTGEEPDYLLWKFANFLGDTSWSFPVDYVSGVTRYEYYWGKINFGQFKVWVYCYDINSQLICEDTISCLKIL